MPPRSTIGVESPRPDNLFQSDVDEWLNDKRKTDGAEGLWRIHDGLYDFSTFLDSHPGGKFWLQDTRGTDITEAFEVHHISTIPEGMLKKFFVRKTTAPRSSPYTFHENGFYKTVKRRVREALKTIPKDGKDLSNKYADAMISATFLAGILANLYWNYYFAAISGVLMGLTIIISHNYAHQRDNFRMYYGDLCTYLNREARIVHIISHHMLTNTIADLQVSGPYPLLNFFPEKKSFMVRYGNLILQPLIAWPTFFTMGLLTRFIKFYKQRGQGVTPTVFLPFVLPLVMYLLGKQSVLYTLFMWNVIVVFGSFTFGFVGFTGTHFHPDIFVDGDTPRANMDWGISQLDSVADRHEVTGNQFLVLVSFGDHALHHLFPTLDHGILPHLYPIVEKTAKEFDLNVRMTTTLDMFMGFFRQVARVTPNPNPPNLENIK